MIHVSSVRSTRLIRLFMYAFFLNLQSYMKTQDYMEKNRFLSNRRRDSGRYFLLFCFAATRPNIQQRDYNLSTSVVCISMLIKLNCIMEEMRDLTFLIKNITSL